MSKVEISASTVMELREKTGAGMMDCKKALAEAQGDPERAAEILREKGLKKSAEKASRVAKEGIILAKVNDEKNYGVMLELNCETDFVAKNDGFVKLAGQLLDQAYETHVNGFDAFLAAPARFNAGKNVADAVSEFTGTIGEKIALKRVASLTTTHGVIASYIHPGNKLGVLLQVDVENLTAGEKNDAYALAYDFAMQTAAMNPTYVNRTEVPQEAIEKESAILREQAKNEGKPEKVLENIIKGRLDKFYQEVCLMDQLFVKDSAKSIKELVNDFSKKLNKKVVVQRFERYRLGD